jgi:hypothetical protein
LYNTSHLFESYAFERKIAQKFFYYTLKFFSEKWLMNAGYMTTTLFIDFQTFDFRNFRFGKISVGVVAISKVHYYDAH